MLKRKSISCNRIANAGYVQKDETVNYIISDRSKLEKKEYKIWWRGFAQVIKISSHD